MTRLRTLSLVIVAALLLTACGGAGSGTSKSGGTAESNATAKLTATFPVYVNGVWSDKTVELTGTHGSVFVYEPTPKPGSSVKYVAYGIEMANYEFDPKKYDMPKKDGDVRITIYVIGDKDATTSTSLKAGHYDASQLSDGENIYGKASDMLVRYFEGGKVQEASINADYPKGTRAGFVKITSVSGDKLRGEVDLTMSEKGSLKGTFFAKLPEIKLYG
jgi:major membrane immunogen (membrane-anchored lipoprotein)